VVLAAHKALRREAAGRRGIGGQGRALMVDLLCCVLLSACAGRRGWRGWMGTPAREVAALLAALLLHALLSASCKGETSLHLRTLTRAQAG